MLSKFFKLKERQTTVRRELMGGVVTFLTMSYILVVNPNVLGETGMDRGALFTATALATIVGTLLMAFLANLPVAQAPGMGLNVFFSYTVVLTMGYSWQFALTAVFIEGLAFVLLTVFNVRELIVKSIPPAIKHAIPVGIGLFITFLGLQQAGVVVKNDATLVGIGNLSSPNVWIAVIGLVVMGVLFARKVTGAILIGILASTACGVFLGQARLPEESLLALPPDIRPILLQFEWGNIFTLDMLVIVFTLLFVNLFDTIGTLIGIALKAGFIDKDGNFPQVRRALLSDALATTAGAALGTSTLTSYIESASGVASGGRTGLTAVSVALMFAVALFFAPLFLMIPAAATAPALIIVGLFMIATVAQLSFDDITEALPAFLTIVVIPFTASIAQGIIFGMLSFVVLKALSSRYRQLSAPMCVIAALLLLKVVLDCLMYG
ncbi:MAG: NCS2 family permease [Prevotellaceae bacterium]|jgi:AGZA family xanthine/uracil permease-like MFS transporter|nr:NCS2 family permease [Prevotellaceae bacterium]